MTYRVCINSVNETDLSVCFIQFTVCPPLPLITSLAPPTNMLLTLPTILLYNIFDPSSHLSHLRLSSLFIALAATASFVDPRGQPMAGSDHCFCTCRLFIHPSIRHHFSKQNKFQVKTMFGTGKSVGLAEWIIDDTLVL